MQNANPDRSVWVRGHWRGRVGKGGKPPAQKQAIDGPLRSRLGTGSGGAGLVDHMQLFASAGEREDSVGQAVRAYDRHVETPGARPVICSQDRPQACEVEEGDIAKVEDDAPWQGRLGETVERALNRADARQVEVALKAHVQRCVRLADAHGQRRCVRHDLARLSRASPGENEGPSAWACFQPTPAGQARLYGSERDAPLAQSAGGLPSRLRNQPGYHPPRRITHQPSRRNR